jgi:hypothetical protein
LLGLALILPGCGDEGTATAGEEKPTSRQATAPSAAKSGASGAKPGDRSVARQCGRILSDFLDSIESLENTLAVGLDYDSYLLAVNHVRSTYAELPADRLPIPCLALVGTPAENALNVYIDAANTWGNCLAGTSCKPELVEPKLQRRWGEASSHLTEARSGLRDLG